MIRLDHISPTLILKHTYMQLCSTISYCLPTWSLTTLELLRSTVTSWSSLTIALHSHATKPWLLRISYRAMQLHIIFSFKTARHQHLLHFPRNIIWDKCASLGQSHRHSSQSLHTKTTVVKNPSFIHAPKFGMTFLITSELYHLPHISKDMQTTPSQHLYLHSLIVHVLFKYCFHYLYYLFVFF